MEYKFFERDYILRTIEVIRQYGECVPDSPDKYEVTLLMNSLLGLLVVPREHLWKQVPPWPIEELKEWGFERQYIKRGGDAVPDLRQLIRHLRNAVAHTNVRPVGNGEKITHLRFNSFEEVWDRDTGKVESRRPIEIVMPESSLRRFAIELGTMFVSK